MSDKFASPARRDPIAARSTTRVLAVPSTISGCGLAPTRSPSQDTAEEIKDSDGNPIVGDKAVSANMAIKTGLLDLSSDSDTVAEVVLSHLCTFLKWRKHFRLITSTSPENVLSNFRCVHKL